MAELALVASIVQVADIGLRLSLRLYTFGETVASADQSIRNISKDVSLTSAVLKELGNTFENDKAGISSDNATSTAKDVVQECHTVFDEMEALLLKKVPHLSSAGDVRSKAKMVLERLKWPTIKGKIELLNYTLDKMKSTLTLMLNVIIYAQQISKRDESPSVLAEQRQLIEYLAQVKQEQERALQQAQLRINHIQAEPDPVTIGPTAQSYFVRPMTDSQFTASDASTFVAAINPAAEKIVDQKVMGDLEALLWEYTRLQSNLLEEVCSANYNIGMDSRVRIQKNIVSTNTSEVVRIRQQTELLEQSSEAFIPFSPHKAPPFQWEDPQQDSPSKLPAEWTKQQREAMEEMSAEFQYMGAPHHLEPMSVPKPPPAENSNSRSSFGSHYIPCGESFAGQKGGIWQPTSASNQAERQHMLDTGADPEPFGQQIQIIEEARAWPKDFKKGVKRGKMVYDEQREEEVEEVQQEEEEEAAEEVQEVQEVQQKEEEEAAEEVEEVAEDEEEESKNKKERHDWQTTGIHRAKVWLDDEPQTQLAPLESSHNISFDMVVHDLLTKWTTLDSADIFRSANV